MMRVHALVPVKDFAKAKSRLATALDPGARAALARHMAAHVIETLHECASVVSITVLASSDEVESWARAHGCDVVRDPPVVRGLADVVDHGLAAREHHLPDHALVVMSDLPRLETSEVDAMIAMLASADVVVAIDAEGQGTNALALRLPAPFPSCFGNVDSGLRHERRAREHGLAVTVVRLPGFEHDVDGPGAL